MVFSMKLSFSTLACPGAPVEEVIGLAKRFGYSGVDFCVSGQPGDISKQLTSKAADAMRKKMTVAGVEIASLFCYSPTLATTSDEPEIVSYIADLMRLAHMLNAPAIRLFTGDVHSRKNSRDYLARFATLLMRALELELHTAILIQNHSNHCNVEEACSLIDLLGDSPRVRLAFSPDHCLSPNTDWDSLLDKALPYTGQIYLADRLTRADGVEHVLPGEGEVPLKKVFRYFAKHGYKGYCTFKWEKRWNQELAPPEAALPVYIDFITKIKGVSQ
jgi:sugar phosphate isomerase/epimerase